MSVLATIAGLLSGRLRRLQWFGHVADPVDHVAPRCTEPRCSRAIGHPGPHRSVNFDGGPSNTFWMPS